VPEFLWDASALVKHYFIEVGSTSVDALLAAEVPQVTTLIGVAETAANLRRKRNEGGLSERAFRAVRTALEAEVFSSGRLLALSVEDSDWLGGIRLADRHNLNSSDGAILSRLLRHAPPAGAGTRVLLAADRRLLRAAAAEGLSTANPETLTAAEIVALLAS
jgi:predicted nucleic acid-binding protein